MIKGVEKGRVLSKEFKGVKETNRQKRRLPNARLLEMKV
jgi:hypothetical protein